MTNLTQLWRHAVSYHTDVVWIKDDFIEVIDTIVVQQL